MPELIMIYIILYAFMFIFGSCIASFLNVIIYRVPRKINFIKGRSFCPSCEHQLSGIDMIPIFSWLFQRRKCRYCGEKISPRYITVELIGGILAILIFSVFGLSFTSLAVFALIAGLIAISFIDIDTLEIPNGLIVYLIFPAIALAFLFPGVKMVSHIIGVAAAVPMLLFALLIKDSFGGGDIKLMAVCGFALGWQLSLVALFFALIVGGIYGVYLLAVKKAGRKQLFAFAPCLSVGIAVSLLYGKPLLDWYITTFFR